jgi:hypothetical protein
MWWPENGELSDGGEVLNVSDPGLVALADSGGDVLPASAEDRTLAAPPSRPPHPSNAASGNIDGSTLHALPNDYPSDPPHLGSGGGNSGFDTGNEAFEDFGLNVEHVKIDGDAESFAGEGGLEDSTSSPRLVMEGSSEHHDTLGPLSRDIETGRISGSGQYLKTQTTAFAEPSRDSGRRLSKGLDLATGTKGGGAREHYARIRSRSSGVPLSPATRRTRALAKFFRPPAEADGSKELSPRQRFAQQKSQHMDQLADDEVFKSSLHGRIMVSTRNWDATKPQASSHHRPFGTSNHNGSREDRVYEPGVGESLVQSEGRQYRLQAVSARERAEGTFWYNLLTCFGCGRTYNIYDDPNDANMANSRWSTNAFVIRYLHWTFRSSFLAVFMSSFIAYFFIITIFALGIWSIALRRPGCVGGVVIKASIRSFSDCWQLSFNTFSTSVR